MTRCLLLAPLLLLLLLHITTAANSELQSWSQADFSKNFKERDAFVMFFAPWCGHCKKLHPTFKTVNGDASSVSVAQVDCTNNQDLCKQLQVRGYPTLLYFHNGKMHEYSGQRTKEALENFIEEGWTKVEGKSVPDLSSLSSNNAADDEPASAPASNNAASDLPSSVITLTKANFSTIETTGGKWVLEFYAPWCGFCRRYAPEYEKFASRVKYNVAKINCDEEKLVCSMFGVKGYPTLKLVENGRVYSISNRDPDAIIEYAESDKSNTDSEPLPKFDFVSMLQRELLSGYKDIVTDFDDLKKYKKGVLSVVFAAGALLGSIGTSFILMMLCMCCAGGSRKKHPKQE